jgi:hypothetical protein
MKKLFTYLFLFILSFSIPSHANDIKEFEIEGISIGDSLLNHLSEKEIIEEMEINKPSYNYLNSDFAEVYLFKEFKNYKSLSFFVRPNDKKYIIYFIKGSNPYDNELDQCLMKQQEIAKEFSKIFNNAKKDEYSLKYDFDKTGKSKTYNVTFYLESGGYAEINCSKYEKNIKKEYNFNDSLQVVIGAEEILNWFDNPIN